MSIERVGPMDLTVVAATRELRQSSVRAASATTLRAVFRLPHRTGLFRRFARANRRVAGAGRHPRVPAQSALSTGHGESSTSISC